MTRRIMTTLDFVPPECRAWEALAGIGSPDFVPSGSAYSASGREIPFSLGLAPIVSATWYVIWNPQGDPDAGVRLHAQWLPDSPIVLETATPYEQPVVSSPTTNSTRIGSALIQLQQIQTRGVNVWIEQFLRGRPTIFASYLQLVWDL